MKKTAVSAVILGVMVLYAGLVFAQPPGGGRFPPPPDVDELDEVLDLTDEQRNQIERLFSRTRSDSQQGGMRQGGRQMEQLGMILTDEQMRHYMDYTQRKRTEMQVQRLDEQLDLTDDQVAALMKVYEKQNQAFAEMRGSMGGPPGAGGGGNFEEIRERMMEVREQMNAEIQEILTGEQYEEYQETQRNFMGRRPQ